jgi:signal peptidase I
MTMPTAAETPAAGMGGNGEAPAMAGVGRRAIVVFTVKVVLSALVMAGTTTMFSLFVWTVLPFTAGWSPSVVVTGSMEPSIMPGDIVVTAPIKPEALKLGYVIRFKDPAHTHPYLMHRIIQINGDGTVTTKGDANQSQDSTPVPTENITGVARLRVPVIGLPAVWLRNGNYLQLGVLLVVVAFAARVLTGLRTLIAADPTTNRTDGSEPSDIGGAEDPDVGRLATEVMVEAVAPVAHAAPTAAPPVGVPLVAAPPVGAPLVAAIAAPHPDPAHRTAHDRRVPAAVATEARVIGRHRGEGRASWRRERPGTRPRSRSRDRERAAAE